MQITEATRIYIAGCAGMLGDAVYDRFSRIATVFATDINLIEPWLTYADVRDYAAIRESVRRFNPQIILNLAAITDLEDCERDQENAWLTNALGAENLGRIANELGATYLYVSTAGIFDGLLESYTDFDEPNPQGSYGRSKFYGESFVRREVPRHFVLRAGWMMGGGPSKDKKFLNKVYRQLCAGSKELFVVDDKVGTPTYTVDFAAGMQRLLESGMFGLYNHGGEGRCSRLDVALEFIRVLGMTGSVKVTKVDSSFWSKEYFAARPASEALVNLKLRARGLSPMRDWRECVAEYAQLFVRDWSARQTP